MSSNRFNRSGRDFLQENKQKVAHWETNGRLTAAAAAKRVNLWRPVVLHYTEKVRPHNLRNNRTNRSQIESGKTHSGLAQPYGTFQSPEERSVGRLAMRASKNRRAAGGDEKSKQTHRMAKQTQTQTQTQTEESSKKQQPPKQSSLDGNEDDALSVYSMRSHASRRSNISKISKKSSLHLAAGGGGAGAGGDDDNNSGAPLSARSNSSLKTIKSMATVRSTCSVKSRATIKSEESIKSRATLRSHVSDKSKASSLAKSQISRRSVSGRESSQHVTHQKTPPLPTEAVVGGGAACGCAYHPHGQDQRQAALNEAHYKYGKLIEEYNHMPVSEPTLRVRNRKIAIERELDQLDYAINMYDHTHMYYKR